MLQTTDSSVPIAIQGQSFSLRWDLNAILTLDRVFGIKVADFPKLQKAEQERLEKGETADVAANIEFAMKLIFAMTRTAHPELSLNDVGGMSVAEMDAAQGLVQQAMLRGREGPLGKDEAADGKPAAGSELRGTGTRRSRRQSAAAD